MRILTIGYEGSVIDDFLASLRAAGVQEVVDVRELPLSRKRGFSKGALSLALEAAGISYRHVRELGCPKDVRVKYKLDQDWAHYVRRFSAYLDTQREALEALRLGATKVTTALLCFEADANRCHRSIVAAAVSRKRGDQVTHLSTTKEAASANHPACWAVAGTAD